jgi:hypothetical protein
MLPGGCVGWVGCPWWGGAGEVGGDDLEGSFPVALGGCLGVGEGPKEFMGEEDFVVLAI